jgi:hypothetical protein
MYALDPTDPDDPNHTTPQPCAPVATNPPRYIALLWNSPLAIIASALVRFWKWYYRV